MARRMSVTVAVAALMLALGACGTPGESPSQGAPTSAPSTPSSPDGTAPGEPEQSSLTVAISGGLDFSKGPLYKFQQDLAEQGIDVQIDVFDTTQDAFRAVVAGEADIAEGAILTAISLAQAQGGGVKVIVTHEQVPDYLLISRPDFETLQQLEGARVGISTPGDTSDTLTRLVFQREGVDVDSIDWIQVGGTGARMAGLLGNQIDAGIAHAAEGLTASQEGGLNVLYRIADSVPDYLQSGLMTTDEFIAGNPNLTQLVVDTLIDALRWADAEKQEYIALTSEVVPDLSEEAMDAAWDIYHEIGKFSTNGGLSVEQMDNTIQIEQEVGNLTGDVPDQPTFVDRSFVEDYLARNGEI